MTIVVKSNLTDAQVVRCLQVALRPPVALGNKGGMITLLDAQGLKVDDVAYTAAEASEGWTVVF